MTSCSVYLCADKKPFSYVSRPYLPLWLDDRYSNAISHLSHLFLEVYCLFDISILVQRNSNELLQPYPCLKKKSLSRYRCLQSPFFLSIDPLSPSPFLLSVLFVDDPQICTPKAVCPLTWLCVQHGHRECNRTGVLLTFNIHVSFYSD